MSMLLLVAENIYIFTRQLNLAWHVHMWTHTHKHTHNRSGI